jgi:hypothetical protein
VSETDDPLMNLPERRPYLAASEALVSFDIDCGELVPSHNFVAGWRLRPWRTSNLRCRCRDGARMAGCPVAH